MGGTESRGYNMVVDEDKPNQSFPRAIALMLDPELTRAYWTNCYEDVE